jgi:hypothetical protein
VPAGADWAKREKGGRVVLGRRWGRKRPVGPEVRRRKMVLLFGLQEFSNGHQKKFATNFQGENLRGISKEI